MKRKRQQHLGEQSTGWTFKYSAWGEIDAQWRKCFSDYTMWKLDWLSIKQHIWKHCSGEIPRWSMWSWMSFWRSSRTSRTLAGPSKLSGRTRWYQIRWRPWKFCKGIFHPNPIVFFKKLAIPVCSGFEACVWQGWQEQGWVREQNGGWQK